MGSDDLKQFIQDAGAGQHLRVEDDLGDGYVRLLSAEAERRQAKHDIRGSEDIVIEMLRNARDAGARNVFVATQREASKRRIVMIDDGEGIPEHLTERIFEARVTSKLDSMHYDKWGVHGRGMALYAISVNTERAFVAATQMGGGSAIVVETDINNLPEKTDQSSYPTFTVSDTGTIIVRGPRNINRTVSEFAYVDRENCSVYYGSPVEIASTLWEFGKQTVPGSTRAFCTDVNELAICKRLVIAQTPDEFAETSASIGLAISGRSARRIMDGEIAPLTALADTIDPYASSASKSSKDKNDTPSSSDTSHIAKARSFKDKRGLKVQQDDIEALQQRVAQAFEPLARDYYLDKEVIPQVKVRRDSIRITIPVRKQL